jgi:hypothetical protein
MEEIINLDGGDISETTLQSDTGVELLMNDTRRKSKEDVFSVEKELSDLNDLGDDNLLDEPVPLGKNTSMFEEPIQNTFKKMPDIKSQPVKIETRTKDDILKEKFEYLRKLEHLETKGATVSKKYSMESSLDEMKGEYETIISEKERSNSIKFQGTMLMTALTGIEYMNSVLNPFDINLDGLSEQVSEDIEDYDDIFQELHEKYKSKATMAPEIKMLFKIASAGMMIHMTNSLSKSANLPDVMRQNPDLMNHFTKAAVNSMKDTSPGLNNFMNSFGMSHASDDHPPTGPSSFRTEMKGPDNIDSVINNINKRVNLDEPNESTVSMEEMENISVGSAHSTSRRKKRADKSVISLAV